jgi:hypothetical protein
MGFFGVFRKLTGGTAEVAIAVVSPRRGGKAAVSVDVSVGPEAISTKRVYVKLRCVEQVDIPKYDLPVDSAAKPAERPKPIQVKAEESLFEQEFPLASGQDLAAASQSKFKGEVEIPAHLPPSFVGKNSRIKWFALAGLSTSLTDPSSGWQEIAVA